MSIIHHIPEKYSYSPDHGHLMSVWFPNHPFDIVYQEGRGRFMITTRDLKAGDPVVRSFPYCYAVCDDVKEYCCQYCLDDSTREKEHLKYNCEGCNQVWYCSERCKQLDSVQHEYECATLKQFFENVHWDDPANRTEVKLLCRTLSRRTLEVLKIDLPAEHFIKNERMTFSEFMRLTHDRKNYSEEMLESLRSIVEYVKSLSSWLDDLDVETLLDVVLKTRNNMFNVFKTSTVSLAWGVYIEASLFNHSCMPNVCLFRCHHTPEFQFVAIHDVPKGAELNVTYLGYGDLKERRSHLKEHYFFHCECPRCKEEEVGGSANYQKWYDECHCKAEGCLGYVVPLPTLEDPSRVEKFCNYCSFDPDPEEEADAAPEGEGKEDGPRSPMQS